MYNIRRKKIVNRINYFEEVHIKAIAIHTFLTENQEESLIITDENKNFFNIQLSLNGLCYIIFNKKGINSIACSVDGIERVFLGMGISFPCTISEVSIEIEFLEREFI